MGGKGYITHHNTGVVSGDMEVVNNHACPACHLSVGFLFIWFTPHKISTQLFEMIRETDQPCIIHSPEMPELQAVHNIANRGESV